jgi:alpha-glucosidase
MEVVKKVDQFSSVNEKIAVQFSCIQNMECIEATNVTNTLRLYILSDSIIRVRYKTGKYWERDFSYALNDKLSLSHDASIVKIINNEGEDKVEIQTAFLNIIIHKETLLLDFFDKKSLCLSKDASLDFYEHYENGTCNITYKKSLANGEHFYGLGDKPCAPDLRGKKVGVWATDNYGYEQWTDPLYKSIPFYLALHHNQSYGIFLNNTYRSTFDFGHDQGDKMNIYLDGGELNYYFIYGPEMREVTRQYTLLTGVPELPPLWALGYQQCKWSYYPESEVYDVTNKLREHRIPCDVFYLDIDYMDGYRCFTWDKEKFPEPKTLIQNLKDKGFKTVVIIDPGIKIDEKYSIYSEALEKGYFVKGGEGGYVEGKVWPGDCYFPDFTKPEVRSWWADLFKDLISEKGVAGVWNDMNEPALFDVPNKSFPNTARHDYDGEESSHKRVHNVYGMQMARATYEGVKKYSSGRPLIITRATFSGGQRYSAGWTGDNIASWDHISIANTQTQRLSISGFSFVGSDIGGFIAQPSAELFTRYMASAIFHPFFRNHSSGDHGNQEPWAFDEQTLDLVRSFIEIRYQFLPYIYTSFYKYVNEGLPMLVPGYMYDQEDMHTHYRGDEVMMGESILYSPVYEPEAKDKFVYLPRGNWYYHYSNEFYKGNNEYKIQTPIEEACFFIKAGTMIPQYPVMNYVGEKNIDTLKIKLYCDLGSYEGMLIYEDAGDGYDYEDGLYNEVFYGLDITETRIVIIQSRKGTFKPQYDKYEIEIIGLKASIDKITIDNNKMEGSENLIKCSFNFEKITIELKQ